MRRRPRKTCRSLIAPLVVVPLVVAACVVGASSVAYGAGAPAAVGPDAHAVAPAPAARAALSIPTVGPYGLPAHPGANLPVSPPAVCSAAPLGAACEDAAIYTLDSDRHALGFPPYELPANFLSMPEVRQVFILVNSDRAMYGEPAVYGLSSVSSAWAAAGLAPAQDPVPLGWPISYLGLGNQVYDYASNVARGYPNMLYAYAGWMYDDGYGSGNGDCTSPSAAGCWSHRDDVLGVFYVSVDTNGTIVRYYLADIELGEAAGRSLSGGSDFTQLLTGSQSFFGAGFTYLWSTAQAAGAGSHFFTVPSTTTLTASTKTPVVGENVTYTAKVSPLPTIGGYVNFGGKLAHCATRQVSYGIARCSWTYSLSGPKTVTARFLGNDMVGASPVDTVSLKVTPKPKPAPKVAAKT